MKYLLSFVLIIYSLVASSQQSQFTRVNVTQNFGGPIQDTLSAPYKTGELRTRPQDTALYRFNGRAVGPWRRWDRFDFTGLLGTVNLDTSRNATSATVIATGTDAVILLVNKIANKAGLMSPLDKGRLDSIYQGFFVDSAVLGPGLDKAMSYDGLDSMFIVGVPEDPLPNYYWGTNVDGVLGFWPISTGSSTGNQNLQVTTDFGNTTTNSIIWTTLTGANRSAQLSNFNSRDNTAGLKLRLSTLDGAFNAASTFSLVPAGEGTVSSGIRSAVNLFNMDYNQDTINQEYFSARAMGIRYTVGPHVTGGGVLRPVVYTGSVLIDTLRGTPTVQDTTNTKPVVADINGKLIKTNWQDVVGVGGSMPLVSGGITYSGDTVVLGGALKMPRHLTVFNNREKLNDSLYSYITVTNGNSFNSFNWLLNGSEQRSIMYLSRGYDDDDIQDMPYGGVIHAATRYTHSQGNTNFLTEAAPFRTGYGGFEANSQYYPADSTVMNVSPFGRMMSAYNGDMSIGGLTGFKLRTYSASNFPDYPISGNRMGVDMARAAWVGILRRITGSGLSSYISDWRSYQGGITAPTAETGSYVTKVAGYIAYGGLYRHEGSPSKEKTLAVSTIDSAFGFFANPQWRGLNEVRNGYGFVSDGAGDYNHFRGKTRIAGSRPHVADSWMRQFEVIGTTFLSDSLIANGIVRTPNIQTVSADTTAYKPTVVDATTGVWYKTSWSAIAGGYTDEQAQDAVGLNFDATLLYTDATPLFGINLANANTWTADQSVPSDPYNATTWDGNMEVPTKDAIRDKFESLPIITASNGLTKVVNDIQLGGTLTSDVTINTTSLYKLIVSGSSSDMFKVAQTGSGFYGILVDALEYGISSTANTVPLTLINDDVNTNTVRAVARFYRNDGLNNASNGIGMSFQYMIRNSAGAVPQVGEHRISLSNATSGAETGEMQWHLKNAGGATLLNRMTLSGDGSLTLPVYNTAVTGSTPAFLIGVDVNGKLITQALAGGTITASNGLTKVGNDIQLGGALTSNASIPTSSFSLILSTSTASATPLQVSATSGTAVIGTSTTGSGIYGSTQTGTGGTFTASTSGTGLRAESGSGVAASFLMFPATTNSVTEIIKIQSNTSGTATAGIGPGIGLYAEMSPTTELRIASVDARTIDLTAASEDAAIDFNTVNAGTMERSVSVENGLVLYNTLVAPAASVANGIRLYSEDVAASAEFRVRDEAGNITTLSPHNFSGIPGGPSEKMAWAHYSEKDGTYINVDMLKLARILENEFPKYGKLVFTGKTKDKKVKK